VRGPALAFVYPVQITNYKHYVHKYVPKFDRLWITKFMADLRWFYFLFGDTLKY
jgi:hypothetical protein